MQCARAIPVTWLGSGSCQARPSRLNTNEWIQWFQFIWYPGQCLSQPLNHYSHFIHHVSLTNENLPANFSPETLASHYHNSNEFYSVWNGKNCIWNTMRKHISKLYTAEPRTGYVRNSANITKWIKALLAKTAVTEWTKWQWPRCTCCLYKCSTCTEINRSKHQT